MLKLLFSGSGMGSSNKINDIAVELCALIEGDDEYSVTTMMDDKILVIKLVLCAQVSVRVCVCVCACVCVQAVTQDRVQVFQRCLNVFVFLHHPGDNAVQNNPPTHSLRLSFSFFSLPVWHSVYLSLL